MSASKICQFCGANIDVNASICNHCKAVLNQNAVPGSRPVPPPVPPPRATAPPPPLRPNGPGAPPIAQTTSAPPPAPSRPSAPPIPPAPAPASPTFTMPTPSPQAPSAPPASPAPPAAPSKPVQPVATPQSHTPQPAAPGYNQASQQARKSTGGLKIIILVFLLILIGGGVYFLFLKPTEPPVASPNLPSDTAAGQHVTQPVENQTQQPVETQPAQQTETQPVEQTPTEVVDQQAQNQSAENLIYYVITEPGSNLFIRKSPGRTNKTSDDVITRVPRGTRMEIIDTHNDNIRIDGFTWWEAKDPSTNVSGWVAKEYLSTNASDVQR